MEIMDFEMDFPEIDGFSDRQIWYAKQLRELYVKEHEERFREIERTLLYELDNRSFNYDDEELLPTYEVELSECDLVVLNSQSAGAIIAKLKEWRECDGSR